LVLSTRTATSFSIAATVTVSAFDSRSRPTVRRRATVRADGRLRSGKVVVKLFLRHPLHAKLYLLFRPDPNNPVTGLLGSSNLTLSGLSKQGELNVDVLDHDATQKLAKWFDERWVDRWCLVPSAAVCFDPRPCARGDPEKLRWFKPSYGFDPRPRARGDLLDLPDV
jgi:phosphatidylserine/phosphatidylglycerophosphate/cardiolipin synthase-like enzyme